MLKFWIDVLENRQKILKIYGYSSKRPKLKDIVKKYPSVARRASAEHIKADKQMPAQRENPEMGVFQKYMYCENLKSELSAKRDEIFFAQAYLRLA